MPPFEIMMRTLDRKTPFEGKTDRWLTIFVPVVVCLALGTGLVCMAGGLPLEAALIRAVTVLVISCPCSLGIAIPLARVAGISMAARRGILVRDFTAFEQIEKLGAIVFDKTGTITLGKWRLREVIANGPYSEEQIVSMAAGLEQYSDHYIAREIRNRADRLLVQAASVSRIEHHENGISGYVGDQSVRIGAQAVVSDAVRSISRDLKTAPISDSIESRVFLTVDDMPAGVFVFGDRIKNGVANTLHRLRRSGLKLFMVSGDGQETTERVAEKIGISKAVGDLRPGQKASYVKSLQQDGLCVSMVGDGINDALALVQSDLGIAMHAGGHLGKEAAAVTLMQGEPGQLPVLATLAGKVNRKISQNLVLAFGYNAIGIPIAMMGILSPIVAVCAMLLSSLSVIGNTLLLMRSERQTDSGTNFS